MARASIRGSLATWELWELNFIEIFFSSDIFDPNLSLIEIQDVAFLLPKKNFEWLLQIFTSEVVDIFISNI